MYKQTYVILETDCKVDVWSEFLCIYKNELWTFSIQMVKVQLHHGIVRLNGQYLTL